MKYKTQIQNSGPEILFQGCVAMKLVDDDDDCAVEYVALR